MDDLSPSDLAAMQAALVRAALLEEPLPGGAMPVALPERGFLPADGPVPLAADHLAPGAMPALQAVARAAAEGDAAYLRFQPPRRETDGVWLTLEVVQHDAGVAGPQPLGGVQAGFARTAAGWRATDEPRAYAT